MSNPKDKEISDLIIENEQLEGEVARLETTIERITQIGYETHPSWGASDEFNRGWKACRELIQDILDE